MRKEENAVLDINNDKTCCICGNSGRVSHEIEFHYGKKTGTGKVAKTDIDSHVTSGSYKGYVCYNCFAKSQMPPIIIGILVALMVLSGSIYMTIALDMGNYPFALSIFYIVIGFGIHQSLKLNKKYRTGDIDKMVIDEAAKLLIKEKAGDYYKQGYDTFWTPDEFDFMERKRNPPPPQAAKEESKS